VSAAASCWPPTIVGHGQSASRDVGLKILKFRYQRGRAPVEVGEDSNSTGDGGRSSNSGQEASTDGNNNIDDQKESCYAMDEVQAQLQLLLAARPYEEMREHCDFSLADQAEAAMAKGVAPAASADYRPVVKKSVTYIVAAVLVDDRGAVLMMQVSSPPRGKMSCRPLAEKLLLASLAARSLQVRVKFPLFPFRL